MNIKVNAETGCPNCPFGKAMTDPWTGEIYFSCYAHIFLLKELTELRWLVGQQGPPEKCPLRRGSITVELKS